MSYLADIIAWQATREGAVVSEEQVSEFQPENGTGVDRRGHSNGHDSRLRAHPSEIHAAPPGQLVDAYFEDVDESVFLALLQAVPSRPRRALLAPLGAGQSRRVGPALAGRLRTALLHASGADRAGRVVMLAGPGVFAVEECASWPVEQLLTVLAGDDDALAALARTDAISRLEALEHTEPAVRRLGLAALYEERGPMSAVALGWLLAEDVVPPDASEGLQRAWAKTRKRFPELPAMPRSLTAVVAIIREARRVTEAQAGSDLLSEQTADQDDTTGAQLSDVDSAFGRVPLDVSAKETGIELVAFQHKREELGRRHQHVLSALEHLGSQVAAGGQADEREIGALTSWNLALAEIAHLAGIPKAEATVESIDVALDAVMAAADERARAGDLDRILRELAAATPSPGAESLLRPVLEAASSRIGAELTSDEERAYAALHELLSTPAWEVDDDDAAAVEAFFNKRVMVVAAGEVLDLSEARRAQVADVDAPIVSPAADPAALVSPLPSEPSITPAPNAATSDPIEHPEISSSSKSVPKRQPAKASEIGASSDQAAPTPPQHVDKDPYALLLQEPPITEALAAGSYALAYWQAVARNADDVALAVLEALALTPHISADGDDVSLRVRSLCTALNTEALAGSPGFVKLAASAASRAALRMPFSPATDVLQDTCDLLGEDQPRFLDAVIQAVRRGVELGSLQEQNRRSLPELLAARDAALSALREAFEIAPQRRTRLSRATNIWRQMLATKGRGKLGRAVAGTLEAPNDLEAAQLLLVELDDERDLDRHIDEMDALLHPIAARKSKIIAGARSDLRELTRGLLAVLQEYVEAGLAVATREQHRSSNEVPEAVELLTQAVTTDDCRELTTDVGDVTLTATRAWIHGVLQRQVQLPRVGTTPTTVLGRELALAHEVDRDADGFVQPGSVTTAMLDLLAGRTAGEAYDGFAAKDDHVGLEQLIETLRSAGESDQADQFEERQREDLKHSRERLRLLIADADRVLALGLSTALLAETDSAELRARLERVRADEPADFVQARSELQSIVSQVKAAEAAALERARKQLSEAHASDATKTRIASLLDQGDLVNAQEFLAQIAAGAQELPPEATADQTFRLFWPAFPAEAEAAAAAGDPAAAQLDWLTDLIANRGAVAGRQLLPVEASPLIAKGLEAWVGLARDKRGGEYQRQLQSVLEMLGLRVLGPFDNKDKGQRLRWWTAVRADRVGQALVATYGSGSNGQYQILLCWDRLTADRLLDVVAERSSTPPVIVFYFNALSLRERRALAERSRPQNKNLSAVVFDHAVMAFLATGEDAGLQTSLTTTLPFTSINPYTPFALGDVPREVFYGRKVELTRVQDPNDALFVYGGRQLGKSALLKTATREFQEADDRWRSVYVDLKAEGVGEWRHPDDIWPVLLPQLVQAGLVDSKVSSKAPPEVIISSIRKWLDADSDRRFLLLLDEADAFLETDARPRAEAVGDARFVNVYRLKGLMDSTSRRFKPVFAGLHQVQRFHTTSNGPMAHVGAEIPIGPLPPAEAFKLVVRPLGAIGYEFSSPDAVWRLLNYTNYQASLIQLFCDALVRRLHKRGLAAGAPPSVVDSAMVDEVYADKELRDQIATRFEWTINLDNRYRVIAYATAWLSLTGSAQLFSPVTLHDECSTFWSAGFQSLSLDTFVAYLDEMVGLGVLVRTPDGEYGIRSPNVIRLLGSPEEIERRLQESDALEVSRPFDPALYRRALNSNPDVRSPLSEMQAKRLLDTRTERGPDGLQLPIVHLVVGTTALGLDRVPQALAEAAGDDVEVHPCTPATLAQTLTAISRVKGGRHHVTLNSNGLSNAEMEPALARVVRQVSADERLTASCLAPLGSSFAAADLVLEGGLGLRTHLIPWNDDALRAWAPECSYPLTNAREREELLQATGGWPRLVEATAAATRAGMTPARAREEALARIVDSADFLESVGLCGDPDADRVAEVLATWADQISFGDLVDLVELDEASVLPVVDRLVDMAVLSRSAGGDAYRINPLIARLLQPDL